MSPHGRPTGEFPPGGTARGAKGAPVSNDRVHAALARLAASREQLKHELLPAPDEHHATGPLPRRVQALWRWVRRRVAGVPVLDVAMQAAQHWWHAHP